MKYMKNIITNSFELGIERTGEIVDNAPLGILIKPELYNNMPNAIIWDEFKKIRADLYSG